jgi:hypothetical protein
MVSPLDVGLLQTFEIIFPFLFILTFTLAFLTKVKPFSDNYVYAAIVAISLSVLSLFSPIALKTINVMAPWFVLLFIATVFSLLAYSVIGYSETDLVTAVTSGPHSSTLGWWVFALVLLIGFGSLATVISEERGFGALTVENGSAALTAGPAEQAGFFQVLLHPKVLGMGVILLVAFFAIGQLSKRSIS